MKLFWMILAGVCIVVAAVFLMRRDFNTAFVIAVLGLVSWFLNYRTQMREIVVAADREQGYDDDEEESFGDSNDD